MRRELPVERNDLFHLECEFPVRQNCIESNLLPLPQPISSVIHCQTENIIPFYAGTK